MIKNFQKPWFAGKSGPCNVDVRCTLGMPEDDLRHGIVEILAATPSAGAVKCSGSLLDNVGQRQLVSARVWQGPADGSGRVASAGVGGAAAGGAAARLPPAGLQVLTASHCRQGANDDGRYYSFLFNYEYPCLASDYHGYSDYVDGGNIVYWDEVVDMMVVEITKPIPMNYRAFFLVRIVLPRSRLAHCSAGASSQGSCAAEPGVGCMPPQGWDVSGQVPGPVLTMHHPRGDVKKIRC